MVLTIQIPGGLLFGFAVTDWMSRTVFMSRIYGRALGMGNLSQFLTGAMALLKWNFRNGFPSALLVVYPYGISYFSCVVPASVFQHFENGSEKIKELIQVVPELPEIMQNNRMI